MRTSTTVYIFALAATACATSEFVDPAATRGGISPFPDGGFFDSGASGFGGQVVGTGGFTTGGFIGTSGTPTGGTRPTTGGAPPTTGGSPPMNTGGATTGGAPVVTGGAPNGGSSGSPQGGTAGSCGTNEKACNGQCVRFGPTNGCSAPSCTACSTPAPTNGVQTCNQGNCDFDCLSGFTKSGSTCTGPTGGGGMGGGGGIMCGTQTCTNSCPLSTQCCKSGGMGCGCNLPILGCQ